MPAIKKMLICCPTSRMELFKGLLREKFQKPGGINFPIGIMMGESGINGLNANSSRGQD